MSAWTDEPGVVELPDGRRIRGAGSRRPRCAVPPPDFAVFLLGRDPAPEGWEYRWVRWRDFRPPDSTEEALAALREAWERADEQRVEIACGGGIGRTGSAVALLAVMSGTEPERAVSWARTHYHRRAVETRRQRRWVEATARTIGAHRD
ncbi:protein-tyrosine phosphatase family protein [Microbacterium bovistercoris]|uniref:protein-tyrosine phosphatase family protein n=1 Tax=Microbacterium bovistercoris TaxID=2293570 RepID=UPI001C6EF6B6|nr:protein-tyrosine phosphatase family protein [Microbacterium bovistercoris]